MDRLHSFTLGDLLRENRRRLPQRTALVCAGERWTFPELDERVNRLSNALLGEGFAPGDRILWLGQNCHRLFECLLAAAKLGGIVVPANWRQTAPELSFQIEDVDARVVCWQDAEIGDRVRAARAEVTSGARWLQHDTTGADGYEAFLATGAPDDPDLDVDPMSAVLAIYTAAFGGRPNGALLSHLGFILEDFQVALLQRLDGETVYLNSGPLFHVGSFMTTMATFQMGGTNVFMPRFDADEFCRLVETERCTTGYVVGNIMERVVEANRDRRYDLSSLRLPGTPEWNEMVSPDVTPWSRNGGGYGQTEVNGLVTFRGIGGDHEGTHGRTLPLAQLRIVDADEHELPPGEVGEIIVRGPTAMVGYLHRPEINEHRQRGGWHHTFDLGRREPDGSITFIGPMTTMIKSGVENIYPAEVEAAIARHPAVAEVCVIGVPDPEWDQSVKAVVVLHADQTATVDDIIEHCKANIASYKKPRLVEFTDALPRDANGIVDRDAVDARFGGGGYPGPGRTRG
ncbi:MAG TPA: AMP-binding protein [Acidimicrobiia bacterium]